MLSPVLVLVLNICAADQNADITSPPDLRDLRREITKTREEWNRVFNAYFGSLFRSGSKQSFFSMQVLRYADLYTTEYTNLLKYACFHRGSQAALTAL